MIIYILSSPKTNSLILTTSEATAERGRKIGPEVECRQWDTERDTTLMLEVEADER